MAFEYSQAHGTTTDRRSRRALYCDGDGDGDVDDDHCHKDDHCPRHACQPVFVVACQPRTLQQANFASFVLAAGRGMLGRRDSADIDRS